MLPKFIAITLMLSITIIILTLWQQYEPGQATAPIFKTTIAPVGTSHIRIGSQLLTLKNAEITYLTADQSQSVVTSSNAAGIASTQHFLPFGKPLTEPISQYSFAGKEVNADIVQFPARGYLPQVGRFISMDPQPRVSTTHYGFANNNPLRYIDPDGKDPDDAQLPHSTDEEPYLPGQPSSDIASLLARPEHYLYTSFSPDLDSFLRSPAKVMHSFYNTLFSNTQQYLQTLNFPEGAQVHLIILYDKRLAQFDMSKYYGEGHDGETAFVDLIGGNYFEQFETLEGQLSTPHAKVSMQVGPKAVNFCSEEQILRDSFRTSILQGSGDPLDKKNHAYSIGVIQPWPVDIDPDKIWSQALAAAVLPSVETPSTPAQAGAGTTSGMWQWITSIFR